MKALVVGCSSDVWDEVKLAQDLVSFDKIYCVKQMGIHWPGQYFIWVTLHPEWMDDYERQRKLLGNLKGYEIVAPLAKEVGMHGAKGNVSRRISYRWPGMGSSAGSGIYGAKVALDDGCRKVVLAGIPMTPEGGHFLPQTKNGTGQVRGKLWTQQSQFVCGLNNSLPFMKGKVKSVSGYTKEVLGEPTREWLNS